MFHIKVPLLKVEVPRGLLVLKYTAAAGDFTWAYLFPKLDGFS